MLKEMEKKRDIKQIIKDRREKINQGIVPEGYKKTKVGIIPEDWEVERLGELSKIYGGESVPRSKLGSSGYPYLHYGDIHSRNKNFINIQKDLDTFFKLDKNLSDVKKGCLLEDGDVVFADASEDYEDIGKHIVIENTTKIPFISGLHTMIAKSWDPRIDNKFRRYLFHNFNVRKQFMFFATGISVLGITLANIRKIKIPIPFYREQQKIADVLSTWDRAIELKEYLIQEKEDQKMGLRQKLLNPSNRSEWKEVRVGEIFTITRGYVLARKFISEEKNEEYKYPVYSSQTKYNGLLGYYNDYLFQDAITWTTDGVNAGETNFREGKFYCTNVCGVLINEQGFANRCMAEIINSETKRYVSYVGNPKLMNNVMKNIKIHLPPLSEQRRIAKILSTADREIELLKQEVEQLKEQKKGLMQLLLTGIVRVKEVEHE